MYTQHSALSTQNSPPQAGVSLQSRIGNDEMATLPLFGSTPPANPETPGQTIARIMRERGLTPKWVAERANLTPNYLSKIINGHKNPTDDTLRRVAQALRIPFYTLKPPAIGGMTLDQVLSDRDKVAYFLDAPLSEEMITWAITVLEIIRSGREDRRLDREPGSGSTSG